MIPKLNVNDEVNARHKWTEFCDRMTVVLKQFARGTRVLFALPSNISMTTIQISYVVTITIPNLE